jgi:tetratricopeptide (TPR) repeat protein
MNRRNTSNKRSLILSDSGLERLEEAIFNTLRYEYTYQQLSDLTKKPGGKQLDPDTISKILKREKSVYRTSLTRLFKAVGLQLQDSDYTYYQPPEPFDPNFVGREKAMQDLDNLVNQGKKAILIQAPGGVGKTILANYYLKNRGFDLVLDLSMAKQAQNITSAESVVEEWLRSDFHEEPGREFGIALKRLRDKLTDKSKKIGVLIDNLEPALENGKFIPEHRQYVELLRVLTDVNVKSVTLITSRELLHEPGIQFEHYPLEGLHRQAWQEVFTHNDIDTGKDALNDDSALSQMHHAYDGNAEAMQILIGDIKIYYHGNVDKFWQESREDLLRNPTLENLVQSQFEKLKVNDEPAYKLLCRLGCYRYQEVPVAKEAVFCLLWDVPEEKFQKRVLDGLQKRGLVKLRDDEYYLHPVMRQEALSRLKLSEDWEIANQKAAEFWTDSVTTVETVEDALTAFEAYYHYVAINDFDRAAEVILKPRENQWHKIQGGELLAFSCYRLGLFNHLKVIEKIVKFVKSEYYQYLSYKIIGDIWSKSFKITQAIKFHIKSKNIAKKLLIINLKSYAEFDIALCLIQMKDYEKAMKRIENILVIKNQKINPQQYNQMVLNNCEIYCWYCLAFLKSSLGFEEEARKLADRVYQILSEVKFSTWGQGYSRVFLGLTYKNLGELEKSRELYHSAIEYAEESHYTQVKAKALYGLAECDRLQGKFDTALPLHREAIEILENIGAKCDLAEAYYQLGLTQQKIGNPESQENFTKAIELFNDIGAPKQVEKVEQAIGKKLG